VLKPVEIPAAKSTYLQNQNINQSPKNGYFKIAVHINVQKIKDTSPKSFHQPDILLFIS
jgi:hypothetical protein